jgi:arsenate reductase
MKDPLDRETLERIIERLPDPPGELIRKDKNFVALELDAASYETAEAVIDLLLEHPKLLQRPIFIVGDRGVIGRPAERVLELL